MFAHEQAALDLRGHLSAAELHAQQVAPSQICYNRDFATSVAWAHRLAPRHRKTQENTEAPPRAAMEQALSESLIVARSAAHMRAQG